MSDLTEGISINNPTNSLVAATNKATRCGQNPTESMVDAKNGYRPFVEKPNLERTCNTNLDSSVVVNDSL